MAENSYCFKNILLQQAPLSHLSGSFANGRVAQTYLFTGSKSIGKLSTAKAFAALLQCFSPIKDEATGFYDACGQCESCKRIRNNSHPDLFHIVPEGYEIRVDQIRQIQQKAVLKPSMDKWEVFIIDPADRLNNFSANSLLKILEEAPSYVIFILLANSTDSVIPTILSRSEIVRFQVPSHESARKELQKLTGFDDKRIANIYALSEGMFGNSILLTSHEFDFAQAPSGIKESHTAFLNELEGFSSALEEKFDGADNIDQALRFAAGLQDETYLPLKCARKEFCRSLVMTAGLPASFSLIFTDLLLAGLEKTRKNIKKFFDKLLNEFRAAYSSAMIKEIDSQVGSALSAWVIFQLQEIIHCLTNWYSDALRWQATKDETLLLNLNRKDDIITLAEIDNTNLIRARIEMLQKSVYLLNRHVQPSLVVENVITQIGGPEA